MNYHWPPRGFTSASVFLSSQLSSILLTHTFTSSIGVANEKGEEWKQMEIYDMILLYKKEVSLNFRLLYGFLSFWNTSVNTFGLPFGIMSPTLHDVVVIVGLPIDGDEVPFLHNVLNTDLGF